MEKLEKPEKPATEVSREGLKDLLEHVRLVHFTMLLVGLVLLTASMRDSRSSVERARRDWESLKQLMPKVNVVRRQVREAYNFDKEGWRTGFEYAYSPVDSPAAEAAAAAAPPRRFECARVLIDTKPVLIKFGSVEMARDEKPLAADPSEGPFVGTVGQVIDVWNRAPLIVAPPSLSGSRTIHCSLPADSTTTQATLATKTQWSELFSNGDHQLALDANASGGDVGYSDTYDSGLAYVIADLRQRVYTAQPGTFQFASGSCDLGEIPPAAIKTDLRAEYAKAKGVERSDWSTATFEENFADLYGLFRDLTDLTAVQADRYLERLRHASGPPIQLFGASMPSETIPMIGAILLVLCQLYFLSHLVPLTDWLCGTVREKWPPAYLATYPDRASFWISVTSSVLLPPLTLAWQTLVEYSIPRGRSTLLILGASYSQATTWNWIVWSVTLAVSLLLGILTFRLLAKINCAARTRL